MIIALCIGSFSIGAGTFALSIIAETSNEVREAKPNWELTQPEKEKKKLNELMVR
jgi:hypothetical protein